MIDLERIYHARTVNELYTAANEIANDPAYGAEGIALEDLDALDAAVRQRAAELSGAAQPEPPPVPLALRLETRPVPDGTALLMFVEPPMAEPGTRFLVATDATPERDVTAELRGGRWDDYECEHVCEIADDPPWTTVAVTVEHGDRSVTETLTRE